MVVNIMYEYNKICMQPATLVRLLTIALETPLWGRLAVSTPWGRERFNKGPFILNFMQIRRKFLENTDLYCITECYSTHVLYW